LYLGRFGTGKFVSSKKNIIFAAGNKKKERTDNGYTTEKKDIEIL
jgi:hypothetical protein